MSADTFLLGGTASSSGGPVASNNGSSFFAISSNSGDIQSATETQIQVKLGAQTLDKGFSHCFSISGGFTGIFGTHLNGANGNVAITITATGDAEDTTHSDSVSAGGLFDWRSTGNAGGSSAITAGVFGCHVSGATTELYTPQIVGGSTYNYSGTANGYTPWGARVGALTNGTEVNTQCKQRAAGSWSNQRANVSSNSIAATMNIVFRKNATTGNQVCAYATTATGIVEDTTHTDAVASGDLTNDGYTTSTATGSANIFFVHTTFSPSAHLWDTLGTVGTVETSSSNVTFYPILGQDSAGNTTEALVQYRYRVANNVANLRGFWINNFSSTGAMTYRVNGANGNGAVTPTSSGTGYFEDSTNHDTIASGDQGDVACGITTSLGWQVNIMLTFGVATNAAATLTLLGQFSQTINAVNQDASHIATQFGQFSQAFAATDEPTFQATIAQTFGLFGTAVNAVDLGAGTGGIRQFWTF